MPLLFSHTRVNNVFLRSISLLLVACLIADPNLAAALSQQLVSVGPRLSNETADGSFFQEQALSVQIPAMAQRRRGDPSSHVWRWLRVVYGAVSGYRHWPQIGMFLAVGYYANFVLLGTSLSQQMNFLQFLLSMYFFSFVIIAVLAALELSFDRTHRPLPFRWILLRQNVNAVWTLTHKRPRWFLELAIWGILLQFVNPLLFYSALFIKWVTPPEFAVLNTASISASPFYERWRKKVPIQPRHLAAGAFTTLGTLLVTGISFKSSAVNSPHHVVGIGMLLVVALILAMTISERVWLKAAIDNELIPQSSHPLAHHFSAIVSLIDYGISSLLFLITGLSVNVLYLHQTLYQWHPRMLVVSFIFATGWSLFYYFQTKLTAPQWLVIFSTLPSWTLLWTWLRRETNVTPRQIIGVVISTLAVLMGTGVLKELYLNVAKSPHLRRIVAKISKTLLVALIAGAFIARLAPYARHLAYWMAGLHVLSDTYEGSSVQSEMARRIRGLASRPVAFSA